MSTDKIKSYKDKFNLSNAELSELWLDMVEKNAGSFALSPHVHDDRYLQKVDDDRYLRKVDTVRYKVRNFLKRIFNG